MKNQILKSTLALATLFSMNSMAQSAIGVTSQWQQLSDSPIRIKRDVLRANRVAQGIGNTVDQALARGEEYCSEAIRKEEARGVQVLALRARIINQVSTYMYTSECDLQVMGR